MKKLLILFWLLIIPSLAFGNYTQVTLGDSLNLTFDHSLELDSARAFFGLHGEDYFQNVKLTTGLSNYSVKGTILLDSAGSYIVRIKYYQADDDTGNNYGNCLVLDLATPADVKAEVWNADDTTGGESGTKGAQLDSALELTEAIKTQTDQFTFTGSNVNSDPQDKDGYSLLDPQTFSLTGNITGNLSGSVGSVTDSVIVAGLDDDTTWLGFLRAGIGGSGSDTTAILALLNNHRWGVDTIWLAVLAEGDSLRRVDTVVYVKTVNSLEETISVSATVYYDSVGKYVADTLAGRGWMPGNGAYSCSVLVLNEDDTPITNVSVFLKNTAGTATIYKNLTNANGFAWFNADSLTYYRVLITVAGYTQDNAYDTFAVSPTHLRDTVTVTTFDPGTPTDPRYCRLYQCGLNDYGGNNLVGARVEIELENFGLKVKTASDSVPVPPKILRQIIKTDANGNWSADVPQAGQLASPADTFDTIIKVYMTDYDVYEYRFIVPSQSQYRVR